jgi:hypothetical protein
MDMEQDNEHGVQSFDPKGQEFIQAIVDAAMQIRNGGGSPLSKQNQLFAVTDTVLKFRKSDPEVVTDKVFDFCMTWIAGAVSFNATSGWRLKAFIAFLAGAVTVLVYGRVA